MSNLQDLAETTKCNFHLEFNPHKATYEDAEEYINTMGNGDGFYDEVGKIDFAKDIWTLQIYPRTPVGFIAGVSNGLDELISWGIEGAKGY